jgi:hypothetical protein
MQLHSWLIEIQKNGGCLGTSPFQIVYRNRDHEHIPVTDHFPADTDYTWNRLGVAQFHVVPGRTFKVVVRDSIVRPSWQLKARVPLQSGNQSEMNQTQAWEADGNKIRGRRGDNPTCLYTIDYLE